jgi:hypothetical protein
MSASVLKLVVPDPNGLKFPEWGAVIAEQLAYAGVAPPIDDNSWKTWVCALFYVPELAANNIPTADGFMTWQEWAQRFIDSVR